MLNTQRFLYLALESIARRKGYDFSMSSYGWIVEIRDQNRIFRTNGYVFDINPPSGVLAAKDKYATHELVSQILPREHLIPSAFIPCSWKEEYIGITKQQILEDFLKTHSFPMVFKELAGSGGKNVFYVENSSSLSRHIDEFEALGYDGILSSYVNSNAELRIILLDGNVQLAYYKHPRETSWKYNLSEGAEAEPLSKDQYSSVEPIIKEARAICMHLGLRFASCDFLMLSNGSHRFLEINSGVCVDRFVQMYPEFAPDLEKMYEEAMEKSFHIGK